MQNTSAFNLLTPNKNTR